MRGFFAIILAVALICSGAVRAASHCPCLEALGQAHQHTPANNHAAAFNPPHSGHESLSAAQLEAGQQAPDQPSQSPPSHPTKDSQEKLAAANCLAKAGASIIAVAPMDDLGGLVALGSVALEI